jgi:heme exporter protein D
MINEQFFAMGGYAFYVWLSYGLSTVILLLNAVLPARKERKLLLAIAERSREKATIK